MNTSRITEQYEHGVEEFLQFAQSKVEPMWENNFVHVSSVEMGGAK